MPNTERKRVHVAVGVIQRDENILIALRPDHIHMGGFWEFPGGKVDAGETVQQALVRELQEELAIVVTGFEPLMKIVHDYPDKSVCLDVWFVTNFAGEPKGVEGQEVRWVSKHDLASYDFPAANKAIVAKLLA